MNKFFTFLMLGALNLTAQAQITLTPNYQPYGKIDNADLEMKECGFEKDANAEVLFDKGTVYFDLSYNLIFERHTRLKIFNDKGKNEGNIRILYYSFEHVESIRGLQAEVINLVNGKQEITKVDKNSIYTENVDKYLSALVFSFPNVQPGSVLEFKYTRTSAAIGDFPAWYFQNNTPTRYSEINSTIPDILYYKNLVMVNHPFVKNTENIKALANIPSTKIEPYMSSKRDNSERILYELTTINIPGRLYANFSDSWKKVGENEVKYDDFGGQFRRKLTGEEAIITKAKALKNDDEKIAYIFNEVKNNMKWNNNDGAYTDDGTVKAWDKKIGNSTEINLILYHLLKKADVKAYPMLISTRENGKINPSYPSKYQFNRTVAYIPVDSTKFYLLDATDKYNIYNEPPSSALNRFGLCINKDEEKYELVFLEKTIPVLETVFVNAEIKPDGKMVGTATLNSFSYNRINSVEKYKTDGEKKYIDYLRDDDNNLNISSIKFENMETDTLPLTQNLDFNLELAGSDENYIYFNSNIFTSLRTNPFLSEKRYSDIDFGFLNKYSINGIYKLPVGYKVDALPKSVSMTMSDNSIVFKRFVAAEDGVVSIRYVIDYKKSMYFKEDYEEFHEFYKKMHDMLDEQIVLKKS